MTVRINKQKINLREKLTEFEDKVNFDEVVRGLGEYTGNVGIGVTAPGSKFHIRGDGSTETKLTIDSETNNHAASISFKADSERAKIIGGYDSGGGGFIKFNTDTVGGTAADRMIIDNAGNVGIGTTDPGYKLDIQGSTNGSTPLLRLNSTTTANGNPASLVLRSMDAGSNGANYGIAAVSASTSAGTDHYMSIGKWSGSTIESALAIDKDGNVGIGTTNPDYELSVSSSNTTSVDIRAGANSNSSRILFSDPDAVGSGAVVYDHSNDSLYFNTANNTNVLIDSNGNLLVGVTSFSGSTNGKKISVSDNAILESSRGTTSSGSHIRFWNPNGIVGSITTSDSSTSYNTSSDYRLKTDVQPMTGAIERLKALKPVNFEWIADGTRVDGFLAHEAQEVVPEAVTGTKDAMQTEEYEVTPAVYEDIIIPAIDEVVNEDGNVITEAQEERTEQKLVSEAVMGEREVPDYQGIDQSKLVPLLTAAIQEQQQIIEDLKSRIETLESK